MERPAQCLPLRVLPPMAFIAVGLLLAGCATPSHVHVTRGNDAYTHGDYQAALDHYTDALVNRGGNIDARIGLAKAYLKLNQPAHAREQMEMAYSLYPQDPQVLDLLSESMIASGDVAGMQALLASNAQHTNAPEDWLRLGRHLMNAGDLDEAKQAMLLAARVDGGRTAKYQVALAELAAKAGDAQTAKQRYRMALFADPMNEQVKTALRKMGEIPGPGIAIQPTEMASAASN
ncbi:MAG: tetratricopeptide repeat protein [Phycisphaerales bacterium]|nr:tetratricopeptide repeat protein [Phycisphaerales bacterium]